MTPRESYQLARAAICAAIDRECAGRCRSAMIGRLTAALRELESAASEAHEAGALAADVRILDVGQ